MVLSLPFSLIPPSDGLCKQLECGSESPSPQFNRWVLSDGTEEGCVERSLKVCTVIVSSSLSLSPASFFLITISQVYMFDILVVAYSSRFADATAQMVSVLEILEKNFLFGGLQIKGRWRWASMEAAVWYGL